MKLETKLKRKQNSNKKKVEDSNPANTFVEAAYKQGDDLEKHSKELIIEMQKSGKKFIQSTTSDQFQPPKNRKTRSVNNEALHTFPTLSFSPLRLNSKPLPKSTSKSSKKPSLKASKTPPQKPPKKSTSKSSKKPSLKASKTPPQKPPKKSTSKSSKKPSLKASKTPPQKPPKKSFSKAPNKLRSYKNQQQDQKDPSPHNIKGCKTLKKSKNAPKKNHKISPAKKTLKRRKTDEDAEEKIPTNTPKKKSQSPNKETGEGKPKRKRRLKAKLEMDRFAINQADGGIDEDLFKQMFNSLIQDKNGNPQQKFEGLTPENCHEDLKELIWCIFQKYSGEADNTKNGIFGILISCALLLIRENDSPARISELLKGDNDLAVKSKKKYFIHLKSFIIEGDQEVSILKDHLHLINQDDQSRQQDPYDSKRQEVLVPAIATYLSQLQFDKYLEISSRLYHKWMKNSIDPSHEELEENRRKQHYEEKVSTGITHSADRNAQQRVESTDLEEKHSDSLDKPEDDPSQNLMAKFQQELDLSSSSQPESLAENQIQGQPSLI